MSRATRLQATAYHEAGHAVAAFFNRIRVDKVTIRPGEEHYGFTSRQNILRNEEPEWDSSDRLRLKIERHVIVALAGRQAEKRFRGRWNNSGAGADRRSAVKLLSNCVGSDDEVRAYFEFLDLRARHVFARPGAWAAVESVAKALLDYETLTGKQVIAMIRGTIDAEMRSWAAAP